MKGEKRREYKCARKACVRIDAEELDELAVRLMTEYLSDETVLAEIAATADTDGQNADDLARVHSEIAEVRAGLDDLADAVAAGSISVSLAARSEPQLRERLMRADRGSGNSPVRRRCTS